MTCLSRRTTLLSLVSIGLLPATVRAQDLSATGMWSSYVDMEPLPLRIRLVIDDASPPHITLIDIGQFPLTRFEVAGNRLSFESQPLGVTYEGTLSANGLTGQYSQGPVSAPLSFTRDNLFAEDDKPLPDLPQSPEAALKRLQQFTNVPAMGLASSAREKSDQVWVAGLAAYDPTRAVTPADAWHIGSVTKPVTAALCARLVEAGLLKWDMTIGDVLGQNIPDIPAAYSGRTLLHLLSHTAGISRDIDAKLYEGKNWSRLDLTRHILSEPPLSPPVNGHTYSNNGYIVAATMVEVLTGEAWENLVTRHIFEPLGIQSGGFGPPPVLSGHTRQLTAFTPSAQDNPAQTWPAGGIHMNLPDMLRFLRAHRDKPDSFLSPQSWQSLHTPPFGGDYALGWNITPEGLSHSGTNGKWIVDTLISPQKGTCSVAAANAFSWRLAEATNRLAHLAAQAGQATV